MKTIRYKTIAVLSLMLLVAGLYCPIRALLPYLFSKREQADLGIEARTHIPANGVRRPEEVNAASHSIYCRLRELKRAA